MNMRNTKMDSKRIGLLIGCIMLLAGCAGTGGAIPVVDSGRPVSNEDMQSGAGRIVTPQVTQQPRDDSGGVVVLVPDGEGGSSAVQSYPLDSTPSLQAPVTRDSSGSALQADEQLDGPVLALLTSARQQEGSGDLGSASASLERALRIAPREPQVLYRLAQVRLEQGDAAQAEQLAQRGTAGAAEARQRARVAL